MVSSQPRDATRNSMGLLCDVCEASARPPYAAWARAVPAGRLPRSLSDADTRPTGRPQVTRRRWGPASPRGTVGPTPQEIRCPRRTPRPAPRPRRPPRAASAPARHTRRPPSRSRRGRPYRRRPAAGPGSGPALSPPRWSGKKTAVAAALAIGLSSMGAVAAAATLQQGDRWRRRRTGRPAGERRPRRAASRSGCRAPGQGPGPARQLPGAGRAAGAWAGRPGPAPGAARPGRPADLAAAGATPGGPVVGSAARVGRRCSPGGVGGRAPRRVFSVASSSRSCAGPCRRTWRTTRR